MSLDPGAPRLSTSPTSSGQASPISRHARARAEDDVSKKDKAYRRYASGVERALSLFDTALQEWADYISFLGRLFKALQAHPPKVNSIPMSAMVAKRLAQCLDPSLPSGVHQKALDVYAYVFDLIGTDHLSDYLPIYLPGLSPTLSFASLSVRPAFLSLLENQVLRVRPSALRPALRAIILTLLPGLEEETSEEFERTLRLLEGFKEAVKTRGDPDIPSENGAGDEYFWQCFFLASVTSPSRRQGALAFLVRRLPKLSGPINRRRSEPTEDDVLEHQDQGRLPASVEAVVAPEPGLLVRCFAAGLSDDQLLIQRGFLDLLLTHLPLHCTVLQTRVTADDRERLMTAAVGVVARKDMGLNRRLWAWILGPEPGPTDPDPDPDPDPVAGELQSPGSGANTPIEHQSSVQSRYFTQYGLTPLVRGIQKAIDQTDPSPVDRARPFRICLSLMDRGEIGGLVIPAIFLPALESARQYEDIAASKDDFADVLRSASVFFDGVESGLIWGEIWGVLRQALSSSSADAATSLDRLALVRFIVTHFNVREEEMLLVHVPLMALALLVMITSAGDATADARGSGMVFSVDVTASALELAETLVELIPERTFARHATNGSPTLARQKHPWGLRNTEILNNIRDFYERDEGNLDTSSAPFSANDIGELLLRESGSLVKAVLHRDQVRPGLEARAKLLVVLLKKLPPWTSSLQAEIFPIIHGTLVEQAAHDSSLPFPTLSALVSLVTTLAITSPEHEEAEASHRLTELVDPMVRQAWVHLSPSRPKYQVEVVRCLWQLQSALTLGDRRIAAALCALVTEQQVAHRDGRASMPGRRFSILWTHSLNLLNVLSDQLPSSQSPLNMTHGAGMKRFGREDYEIMLSRPLLLLLDACDNEQSEHYTFMRQWLQNLATGDRVLSILMRRLLSFDFLAPVLQGPSGVTAEGGAVDPSQIDVDLCLYYLHTLSNVLRVPTGRIWSAMAREVPLLDEATSEQLTDFGLTPDTTFQGFFAETCMRVLHLKLPSGSSRQSLATSSEAYRGSLTLLQQLLSGPHARVVSDIDWASPLLDRLLASLQDDMPSVQVLLLEAVLAALQLRWVQDEPSPRAAPRPVSKEAGTAPRTSISTERSEQAHVSVAPPPPSTLLECLQGGFSSRESRPILDNWVTFLAECLPYYSETIFQVLIPLVEVFCAQIGQHLKALQETFRTAEDGLEVAPEATLIALLNGIEQILAKAHDRLMTDEVKVEHVKAPEQAQGFFGNMVSGVFTSEAPQPRRATANDRLTVLLSFKDTVRICFAVWSWGTTGSSAVPADSPSLASFNYSSLRIRNRARRLLEHLFAAETLECLETTVEIWKASTLAAQATSIAPVFDLLHVLDGSRPKNTIPAIFNAIYSRANPNALEPTSKSTLASDLADTDVVAFLAEYARSLEDDTMDEIWADCMTFLRDVLANPFPHRQTLPRLLEFAAILGEKADNTTFGEQRKMRRDLSDLFSRLLTATFTTKPIGFSGEPPQPAGTEKPEPRTPIGDGTVSRPVSQSHDVISILAMIVPKLPQILVESDRVLGAATTISTSVIGPTIRAKTFPDNVSTSFLDLLYELSRLPSAQKSWRKDLAEAFNDARFFASPWSLVEQRWLPLLRHWALGDKDRMPELLSRLSAPTTAGIVFGVGATSARMDADRKTQLNLRRIALLILAAADDTTATNIGSIEDKVVELLTATAMSSPSSATRADVYMVLRAVVLKHSSVHLAALWPTINAELQATISSVMPGEESDVYNKTSVLQACKLLDTLLVLAPDEFQLHEWLYITDTIDAVYRPPHWQPVALVDEVSEQLGTTMTPSSTVMHVPPTRPEGQKSSNASISSLRSRRPLLQRLAGSRSSPMLPGKNADVLNSLLKPFFSQLSIYAFESTYAMAPADRKACGDELLVDLFDEGTIVGP